MGENQGLKCSFCKKNQDEVRKLVAGPDVYICDQCIEVCNDVVEELYDNTNEEDDKELLKPNEITEVLDQYVIGQENAKKSLAVAAYNHFKRLNVNNNAKTDDIELDKSNVALIGPTGSGKTLLAKTLAKALDVPFAIVDATTVTEAGYVGDDVESLILNLVRKAEYDIGKAEKGIIFIDEIDKIARKSENPSISRDVSGEGVQQALLKIVEGTEASVPPEGGRKHPNQETIKVNTRNILFIVSGAFDGIEQIVQRRKGKKTIGFGGESKVAEVDAKKLYQEITQEDILKFGLIPELIGRLPVLTGLEPLDKNQLVEILNEPKNALIKQYQKLFELDDIELEFTYDSLETIADMAIERKTGARGLRSIVENLLQDVMFEAPSWDISKITITEEFVRTQNMKLLYDQEKKKTA